MTEARAVASQTLHERYKGRHVRPPFATSGYVLGPIFYRALGVSLHCFLGVPADVNGVRPRGVRMVCSLLVMSRGAWLPLHGGERRV